MDFADDRDIAAYGYSDLKEMLQVFKKYGPRNKWKQDNVYSRDPSENLYEQTIYMRDLYIF